MFKHAVVLFAVGLSGLLFVSSDTSAQPGKGGKGGGGADAVKSLEAELEKLRDQIKDTEAKLAKAKEASKRGGGFEGKGPFGKGFDKGGFGGFGGKGKGGFGPKGFEGMKKGEPKKDEPKKEAGKAGMPPFGPKGEAAKMSPEIIRTKYEFYKKLYDDLPKEKGKSDAPMSGKGKGKGFGSGFGKGAEANSLEARVDRLMRELEEIRKDLKKR